jgi:FkbM family methyltransferase
VHQVDERLRLHDLRLLATVTNYDLRDSEERKRSQRELKALFFRLLEALGPDLFVEAGANDASVSRRARRLVPTARVVAFEANPYTYDRYLADNPPSTGVEFLHLALSDTPGEVSFNVRRSQAGRPRADGHGSLMDRPSDYGHDFEQVTVRATTLDAFFSDHPVERCALWIDVEGASAAVLHGATDLLRRAMLLQIEVEDREYWEGAWTAPQVLDFLHQQGFVPIARDFEYRYQNNVLLIRDGFLDDPEVRLRLARYLSAARHHAPDE